MVTAGIDIGHESVTVVILHEDGTLGHATFVISGEVGAASTLAFERTLDRLGMERAGVHRIFATGMGRENVALADGHRTPMLSHARGAHWWFPGARTVIDVGAEGSRVMRCDEKGNLTNFALNDKCAAGSGVFLETVADMLDVPLAVSDEPIEETAVIVENGAIRALETGPRLPVPTAPAWLQRAGLGADVMGTGAKPRGGEGGGRSCRLCSAHSSTVTASPR